MKMHTVEQMHVKFFQPRHERSLEYRKHDAQQDL